MRQPGASGREADSHLDEAESIGRLGEWDGEERDSDQGCSDQGCADSPHKATTPPALGDQTETEGHTARIERCP